MSSYMLPITLLTTLAISPALTLPHHHQIRDDTSKPKTGMPDWQIALIGIGCILAITSIGLLGGICQGIFCTSRRKPDSAPPPSDATTQALDFGCRGDGESDQSTLVSEHSRTQMTTTGGKKMDAQGSRYSWQDDKGVTTEVYMDGAVPGAGPAMTQQHAGAKYGAGSPGTPEGPIFMISDEQDDEDYQREMARATAQQQNAGYFQPPMAATHGAGPHTPGRQSPSPLSPAWGRPSTESSAGRYFDDVEHQQEVSGGVSKNGYARAATKDEGSGPQRGKFEPWLPTVDLTLEDEPLDVDEPEKKHDAANEPVKNAPAEGKWHPTQFL